MSTLTQDGLKLCAPVLMSVSSRTLADVPEGHKDAEPCYAGPVSGSLKDVHVSDPRGLGHNDHATRDAQLTQEPSRELDLAPTPLTYMHKYAN